MTRISPKTATRVNNTTGTKSVESMLRDIAYVLHLTKKVKASMIKDLATPTGGRFADDAQHISTLGTTELTMAS